VAEDDPSAFLAEGEVRSIVPVVMTLVADVFLVLVALLLWRSGGRRRAGLRALALEDVTRCAPATLLERIGGEDYLIRGEVVEVGEGSVTLDLGNRAVVVLLDGHQNPVGHQQPAQVRARLIS
jgi:hypothetical protein